MNGIELIVAFGTLVGAVLAGFYISLRRLSAASHGADKELERKYADLLRQMGDLEKRLADESSRRRTAEERLDALAQERRRDKLKQRQALAALRSRLSDQRAEIKALSAKIVQLETERDDLRRQRDAAHAEQASLSARLEATTHRLNKAETQIASMQVKEKAFELLFSRLNIGITLNNNEPLKEVSHAT